MAYVRGHAEDYNRWISHGRLSMMVIKKLSKMGERGSRRMVLWNVPPIFPQGSDAPVGRGRLQVKSKHFSWPQYTKIRFVGLVSSAIAYGCLIHTQHRQQQIWSNVAYIYHLLHGHIPGPIAHCDSVFNVQNRSIHVCLNYHSSFLVLRCSSFRAIWRSVPGPINA